MDAGCPSSGARKLGQPVRHLPAVQRLRRCDLRVLCSLPTSSSHSPKITCIFPLGGASFTSRDFARMTVLSLTVPESWTTSASNSPASSPSERISPTFTRPCTAPLALTERAGADTSPSIRPLTSIGQLEDSDPLNCVPSSTSVLRSCFAFLESIIAPSSLVLWLGWPFPSCPAESSFGDGTLARTRTACAPEAARRHP